MVADGVPRRAARGRRDRRCSCSRRSTSPTSGADAAIGAALGIAVAVGLGYGIYRGGVRINLSKFFRATGLVLVLVAAGLVVNALRTAHEAGWLDFGQGTHRRPDLAGRARARCRRRCSPGCSGCRAVRCVIEVIGWLVYLVPVGAVRRVAAGPVAGPPLGDPRAAWPRVPCSAWHRGRARRRDARPSCRAPEHRRRAGRSRSAGPTATVQRGRRAALDAARRPAPAARDGVAAQRLHRTPPGHRRRRAADAR